MLEEAWKELKSQKKELSQDLYHSSAELMHELSIISQIQFDVHDNVEKILNILKVRYKDD